MDQLELILAAWIAFHAQLGVKIEPTLAPPASEVEIQAVETQIGFRLPEDLRWLYKLADGQLNPYDHREELNRKLAPEDLWAPLFGYYSFMSLAEALAEYEFQREMYEDTNAFETQFNQANPDKTIEPTVFDVRAGDPVDPSGWNHSWFPFAKSNADNYYVDMSPPEAGTSGQVVEDGADVSEISVVASSVQNLLEQAALKLDLDEEHRFEISPAEGEYRSTIYFDMDWRNTPFDHEAYKNSLPEPSVAEQEWLAEQERVQEQEDLEFSSWLELQGVARQDIQDMLHFSQYRLGTDPIGMPRANFLKELLTGVAKLGEAVHPSKVDLIEMGEADWDLYYMNLAKAVISSKSKSGEHLSSTIGQGLETQEAITLYHRYQLHTGAWTQASFNKAEALRDEFSKIKLLGDDGSYGYSMVFNGDVLTICQSDFDAETFKSEEHCAEIDVSLYQ